MQLPDKPSTVDEMMKKVEYYLEVVQIQKPKINPIQMDTIPWREGKVQGAVYDFDEEIIKISSKVRQSSFLVYFINYLNFRLMKCSCGQIRYTLTCSRVYEKWRLKLLQWF